MPLAGNLQARYSPLVKPGTDPTDYYEPCTEPRTVTQSWRFKAAVAVFLLVVGLVIGFMCDELIRGREHAGRGRSNCKSLSIRREWRSLSEEEKHQYIEAVRCLAETPSKQLPDDSLYDDFAYVHIDSGEAC